MNFVNNRVDPLAARAHPFSFPNRPSLPRADRPLSTPDGLPFSFTNVVNGELNVIFGLAFAERSWTKR